MGNGVHDEVAKETEVVPSGGGCDKQMMLVFILLIMPQTNHWLNRMALKIIKYTGI